MRRLLELAAAGRLTSVEVRLGAAGAGVTERTMWRWLEQARRSGEITARPRARFDVDDDTRSRLAFWQGNVAALHRELVATAAAGGPPAPALATLHRALARDLPATTREEPAGPGRAADRAAELPDPGCASTLDGLVERLRLLRVQAGNPSYVTIKNRVNAAWTEAGRPSTELVGRTTVVDSFRLGRRRINADLLVAMVEALHPDPGYVAQWRQALQVVTAERGAATQVRVQDSLPPDLAEFTGRAAELERVCAVVADCRREGDAVVLSAIEGMAGVGKTRLAVHAAHHLVREQPFDRVLFVNLRGFHPDQAQPPADPAAVLEGFLRLLGAGGHEIPHDLDGRVALYRQRLAGTRTLVILDNAADTAQVRPLLPAVPGCPALVTSRRSLVDLPAATRLTVDVFTPDEARQFLTRAAPGVEPGEDPDAGARIAARCGHLPLALGLVAGHMRAKPGWTLTDHADWLDERHCGGRLDTGLELALDLSYHHLPADQRRLLRLLALHPGQDLDAYAVAALGGTGLSSARRALRHLHGDHLLQQGDPGRYTVHDLVRAYAAGRAHDEDRAVDRRAALTRLFDYYLATAATAMDTLHPAEAQLRPQVPAAGTEGPDLTDPDVARRWLDTERATLVAVAAHTAAHGWPEYTTRLSRTLYRYLAGGYHADAVTVHSLADQAARAHGDPLGRALALADLGAVHLRTGRFGPAGELFRLALPLFRQVGDLAGEARAHNNLGNVAERTGRFDAAAGHHEHALALFRWIGDATGEARTLINLGSTEGRLGRYPEAADHYEQALMLCRVAGDRTGEANALNYLAEVEMLLDRPDAAGGHMVRAMDLFRQLGNRDGEAWALYSLGLLNTRLGRPGQAADHHRKGLAIFRETGCREGECWMLNGLGEAVLAAGRPAEAGALHTAAHAAAAELGEGEQRARAEAGLGRVYEALGDPVRAAEHFRLALTGYAEFGMPEADQIRDLLASLDPSPTAPNA